MNKQQYEVNNLPTQIVIGHQTETGVTSIYFDCTSWLASWPDLVLGVWVTQPGGTAAYPAATHMEGDVLVWDVTDSDTAVPGTGTMEIVGIASGKKKLSAITKTLIQRTTTGTATEPPEGAKAWVDSVMQAANDAETSKSQAATYAQNAAASAEKAEENAKSVTWETLSGKPSTFPPDSHTHTLESLGAASAESVNQLKNDLDYLKLDITVEQGNAYLNNGEITLTPSPTRIRTEKFKIISASPIKIKESATDYCFHYCRKKDGVWDVGDPSRELKQLLSPVVGAEYIIVVKHITSGVEIDPSEFFNVMEDNVNFHSTKKYADNVQSQITENRESININDDLISKLEKRISVNSIAKFDCYQATSTHFIDRPAETKCVDGKYLYTTHIFHLEKRDLSSMLEPSVIKDINLHSAIPESEIPEGTGVKKQGVCQGMAIRGNYIYIAERQSTGGNEGYGEDGIGVLYVVNKNTMEVVCHTNYKYKLTGMAILDKYLVVGEQFHGFRVYDLTNPEAPVIVASKTYNTVDQIIASTDLNMTQVLGVDAVMRNGKLIIAVGRYKYGIATYEFNPSDNSLNLLSSVSCLDIDGLHDGDNITNVTYDVAIKGNYVYSPISTAYTGYAGTSFDHSGVLYAEINNFVNRKIAEIPEYARPTLGRPLEGDPAPAYCDVINNNLIVNLDDKGIGVFNIAENGDLEWLGKFGSLDNYRISFPFAIGNEGNIYATYDAFDTSLVCKCGVFNIPEFIN